MYPLQDQTMQTHHKIVHRRQLDFFCSNSGCGKRFGYKRNLKSHLRTCMPKPLATVPVTDQLGQSSSTTSLIDQLTGTSYLGESQKTRRVLPCPWPSMADTVQSPRQSCAHVFGRMYDLRRHLKSGHGIEMDTASLADLMIEFPEMP